MLFALQKMLIRAKTFFYFRYESILDDKVDYTEVLEFSDDDEDEVATSNKIDDANGKSIGKSYTASWLVIHVEVIEQSHFSSPLFYNILQFIFLDSYRVSAKRFHIILRLCFCVSHSWRYFH